MRRGVLLCGVLVPLAASPAAGQLLYRQPVAVLGAEGRGYAFRAGLGVQSVAQWSTPIVVAVPLTGALSADVSTRWAHTRLVTTGGQEDELSGLTDTQVRVAYTVGRDALVVSAVANLPTGKNQVDSRGLTVVGAASGDFLALPVSQYGSSANVTGGIAAARSLGQVNVGAGASARISGAYQPFAGIPLTYRPGVETRVQIAGDGLVGRGRVSAGITYSTFGTDDFQAAAGAGISQTFQSGRRFITELGYAGLVAGGTLNAFAWNYSRAAGQVDTTILSSSRQNIFNVGASWRVNTSRGVFVTPLVELKHWSRGGQSAGRLGSLQLELDLRATRTLSVRPRLRVDWGFVADPAGNHVTTQGWGVGLLGRFDL